MRWNDCWGVLLHCRVSRPKIRLHISVSMDMKSEKNRTRLQRLSAFLPAVILMTAIFYFSAQPAEESSVVSESFGTELLGTLNRLLGFGWNLDRVLSTVT